MPSMEGMEEKLGFKYPTATADAGYESEEGYDYMKKNNQMPYIKPQTYEKWKKRSFKNDISKRENMIYDEKNDTYICHNEKKLTAQYVTKKKEGCFPMGSGPLGICRSTGKRLTCRACRWC